MRWIAIDELLNRRPVLAAGATSTTSAAPQGHSPPAGYGAAVSFGPNTWNFRDIVALLLERQAAIVIRNEQELEAFVCRCLTEPEFAAELGRRAQQLVGEQQGAADRTIGLLQALVESAASSVCREAAA